MVIGKNGHGKSTIIDALTFVLFGKPFRPIKKNSLINSVNKRDLMISVSFESGSTQYRIDRGIKPNVFKIFKNDTLINQEAAIKDYQEYLERNILKMNFRTFTQVVVLGSTSYIPFMKLSSTARREMVEELLDIKVFSSMNMMVKSKLRDITDEYRELSNARSILTEKIELNVTQLKYLTDKIIGERGLIDGRIDAEHASLKSIEADIHSVASLGYNLKGELQSEDFDKVYVDMEDLKVLQGQITSKIRSNNKRAKFYLNNEQCTECDQMIDVVFKDNILIESDLKRDELGAGHTAISDALILAKDKMRKFTQWTKEYGEAQVKLSGYESLKEVCELKILEYETDKESTVQNGHEIRKLEDSIVEKGGYLKSIEDKISSNIEDKEYYSLIRKLLADDGVKASIIKTYIPLINKHINNYLQSMEFHARFELDEEFNETIYSRYVDNFQYANFSEGEKQRIDLALLFTWRKIARMKNSANTNLLIIDEIFDSSLDDNGTEEFMKILYTLENENIFVISHKNHMSERFDNVLKFKKKGNFSEVCE
jgi:DNA repair exonuclease SbcCD ATPase subunit